ncbi:ATP-dependent DNA helicase [Nesterenkonia flava]|uniref:DNA 3'-5' helicase n=1 Tax=Nesterenkonia flava TaxID=469799 RepID=A0ABU1FQE4_9MICC|nr:ATP-dependent DNA helicase [Nesterenkonia flava]MDR5710843.1 ATP-dependent DNA helicase [Nesterenkonia flava]
MTPTRLNPAEAVQTGPRYTSDQIAERLGAFAPTFEQREVIEAPLEPTLVIAGAGSGKTATMADRVVYLVANGIVRPDQILGVTFTRKAAGELRERVVAKLTKLVEVGLVDPTALVPEGTLDDDVVLDAEGLVAPVISTYHSYAQSLVTEYGMHIGLEPETELIGEAAAWQLVAPLVERYERGEAFVEARATASTLPSQVLTLAGDCAEHLIDPEQITAYLDAEIARGERLAQQKGKPLTQKEQELLDLLRTRRELPELVRRYHLAKTEQGLMDFGDLLRHAVRIAQTVPVAAEAERGKYKLVLLDEFQDTSYAQLELFAKLFGDGVGTAVTAVGDPNQSIYGFRGASAGQLFDFSHRFPVVDPVTGDRRPAGLRQLTVAWRNGRSILAVANTMVKPFTDSAERPTASWHQSTAHLRRRLNPLRTPDHAPKDPTHPLEQGGPSILPGEKVAAGEVRYGFFTTDAEEAHAIAAHLSEAIEEARRTGHNPPSCAVLAPTHSHLADIAEHLLRAGLDYELLGLRGLLYVPEVAETLAYLRVLADPARSDAMIRILAGARYRLGPKDLRRLGRYASGLEISRTRVPSQAEAASEAESHDDERFPSSELELDERASLIEAVDGLPADTHRLTEQYGFSSVGAQRLLTVQDDFRALRSLVGLELGTLIQRLVATIGLDVEVAARPWEARHHATRQIDAFIEQAQSYAAGAEPTDLRGFLAWLDAAAERERGLEQAPKDPVPGAVQLLTVHASKGLEWDVVAVAGLREEKFPQRKAMAQNWLNSQANLPWPLRGDRASIPQWDSAQESAQHWACSAGIATSKKYEGSIFKEDCAAFAREEQRRLAYVAFTRARTLLICTGASFYGSAGGKEPSEFLQDIRRAAHQADASATAEEHFTELRWYAYDPEDKPENPDSGELEVATWPYDPLAEVPVRRVRLQEADPADPTSIDEYLDVEQEQSRTEGAPTPATRRPALEAAAELVREAQTALQRDHAAQPEELLGEDNPWADSVRYVIRRAALARRGARRPGLPSHLSASRLIALAQDPAEVAEQVRRPVPQRPSRAARRGTVVHAWVEQQFDATAPFPEIDDAVSADKDLEVVFDLERVKENFRSSPWAARQVYAMEIPVELSLEGVTLRGRIDAVFGVDDQNRQLGTADYERWEQLPKAERNAKMAQCSWDLVDWKTGAVPTGRNLEEKKIQLAVYRLAFSRIFGVPLERINAHFVYLDHGQTVTPDALQGAEELSAILGSAREAFGR